MMRYATSMGQCGACIGKLKACSDSVEVSCIRQPYHKPHLYMGNMEATTM